MIALPEPEPPGLGEAPAPPLAQRIVQRGTGNIAVQAEDQSSVTIVIGTSARLTLERRHAAARPVRSEVDLLRAEVAAVPLVGREEPMRRLEAWLDDPAPISVHAIVGGAGTGKTRLALELCRRAEERGWRAGFVAPKELRRFAEQERIAAWDQERPTLFLVDYAARSARSVNALLRALAGQPSPQQKLRWLLLERHAEPEAGWWAEVRRVEGSSDDRLLEWFTGPLPEPLSVLTALEDRRAILAETLGALGRYGLAPSVPELPAAGADPAFEQALAASGAKHTPLFLMLAALYAAEAGLATALALGRLNLALWLAIREQDRLRALAVDRGVNVELVPHLVARITLSRGILAKELPEVIGEERQALRLERSVALEDVAEVLREALPTRQEGEQEGEDVRLSPLEPDIVGEAFSLLVLTRSGFDQPAQQALVTRCGRRSPRRTAQQLVLICQDFARELPAAETRVEPARCRPEFARLPDWLGARNPAVSWLRSLAEEVNDPIDLLEIANQLPPRTLVLRELAVELAHRIEVVVHDLREQERRELLGRALITVGKIRSALDPGQNAVLVLNEAVKLYRGLAKERPDAFEPDLAGSLNTLSATLAKLGRRAEALAAAEESVQLYRGLAKERPDAFRPDLAGSLTTLSARLAKLGRREEAVAAAEESVQLCRGFATERPDAFRRNLANSLTNLSARLAEVAQREEALTLAEEAVNIRRELVAEQPDAFRLDLAVSLNNFGARLSELGRREEAVEVLNEAVELYRGLVKDRPDLFRADLARSLITLCNRLVPLGLLQEALEAVEEAVAIRRALAHERPEAFSPGLAKSLSVCADCLEALGRLAEAVEADEEAVRTLAPFFFRSPRAFRDAVVLYSRDYIARCEKLGREPDTKLLTPIVRKLDELRAQRAHEEN